jgi:hypothetical protein
MRVGRADAPVVGRGCGEGRGVTVEVSDHGAGLVAELKARGGHGSAGLLPELLLERLDDGLRSARPLAIGVRDKIQAGDGVQVVPAGHKDIGVSSDISIASCQSDAHESPSCKLWQIRCHLSKYKDGMKLE